MLNSFTPCVLRTVLRRGLVRMQGSKRSTASSSNNKVVKSSEIGQGSLYDRPDLYALAFGYREFAVEAEFLEAAAAPSPSTPRRFLELGCGPAQHCGAMAARGFMCVGVDINPKMIDYATKAQQAAAPPGSIDLRIGDMRAPPLKDDEKFDIAAVLLGSFSHLMTNEDALACLRAVHAALVPGAAFIVELPHVGDLFDGSLMDPDAQSESWDREEGKLKIGVRWGKEGDDYDYETQIYDRTVDVKVAEVGAAFGPKGAKIVSSWREILQQRMYTAQEMALMASMAGFQMEGVYGDFDKQIGLRHEEAFRSIFVLRKPVAVQI